MTTTDKRPTNRYLIYWLAPPREDWGETEPVEYLIGVADTEDQAKERVKGHPSYVYRENPRWKP